MQRFWIQVTLAACGAAGTIACSTNKSSATSGADTSASVAATTPTTAGAEVAERTADSAQSVGVPKAVADIGTHGEDLYDAVKAANWATARVIMDSLDQSIAALNPQEHAQIAGVADTLRSAIAARQRDTAIEAANHVTFIDAAITAPYHPRMPADISRLDYYGRELEIWAARKNTAKLVSTAADLRRTWDAVRPTEVSHGGSAAAGRTDSLVARLATAKTPADYARLATPILDIVDELEKPFAQ